MDDLRAQQLARARELAKAAKERIKQMSPEERAEYEGKRQADSLRRAERKAAIQRRKEEGASNPYKESAPSPPQEEEQPPKAPTPLDPPTVVPPTVVPPTVEPATPKPSRRKRVRRIVVESSESGSSSGEDEIVMRRSSRGHATTKPRKEQLPSVNHEREQGSYDDVAHFLQMRALGLL